MKNGKNNIGFSYTYMANFEVFRWVISSSINILFLKSEILPTWNLYFADFFVFGRQFYLVWQNLHTFESPF